MDDIVDGFDGLRALDLAHYRNSGSQLFHILSELGYVSGSPHKTECDKIHTCFDTKANVFTILLR